MGKNKRNKKSKQNNGNIMPIITVIVIGFILFIALTYFMGIFIYSTDKNYSCFDTNKKSKQIYVRTFDKDTRNKLCMQMGIEKVMDNVSIESVKYIPNGYEDITDSINDGCQGDISNPVGNKNVLCRTLNDNPLAQVFAYQDSN